MPAVVGSKTRSADPAATADAAPPAKRPRHTHDGGPAGLKAAILAAGHGRKLTAVSTAGITPATRYRVDDARAVVGRADGGGDIDMADPATSHAAQDNSGSDSSDESDDQDEMEQDGELINGSDENAVAAKPLVNGWRKGETRKEDEDADADGDGPTFGELLDSRLQEPIDVEAPFANTLDETAAVARHMPGRNLSAPSATSLGTVLTQALRTNDRELLESCFEMNDLDSVRSTIERLPSSMVANLLHTLAERMHKRPGRAGNLMVWVQWSLVAHGGYIASQPQLTAKLRTLKRVIAERARGLQPLLELKGKLDMLAAQMELRRRMQSSAARGVEEDEDAVIFVEGEEDDSDASDEEAWHSRKPRRRAGQEEEDEEDSEEDSEEENGDSFMPLTTNGINSDPVEEDDSANEEDLIDDEADEADPEETDEDEDDGEVEEEGDDVQSDEETTGPSRRSMAARSGFVMNR